MEESINTLNINFKKEVDNISMMTNDLNKFNKIINEKIQISNETFSAIDMK